MSIKQKKDDSCRYSNCGHECSKKNLVETEKGDLYFDDRSKCVLHPSNRAVRDAFQEIIRGNTKKAFLNHVKSKGIDEPFITIVNYLFRPPLSRKLRGDNPKEDFEHIRNTINHSFGWSKKQEDGKEYSSEVLNKLKEIEELAV